MAYARENTTPGPATPGNALVKTGSASSGDDGIEARVMMQIMKLVQAYGLGDNATSSSTVSVTA